MISQWIAVNRKTIDATKRILLEKDLENSYAELPLMQMHQLIHGAEAEVIRLQNEITRLEGEIRIKDAELSKLTSGSVTVDD